MHIENKWIEKTLKKPSSKPAPKAKKADVKPAATIKPVIIKHGTMTKTLRGIRK